MATLSSTLKLSLDDNVTGPMGRVGRVAAGMRRDIGKAGSTMVAPLGRLAGGFIATAAAVVGISEAYGSTVTPALKLQAQLTELGIKGELSAGQLDVLRRKVQGLAPATNQFTTDLVTGIDTMMAAGVAADTAQNSIGIIGKTATATGATMQDLANTTSSLVQNLDVSAGRELQKSLEAMTYAGNAGAFEVRDMAQYFPQLTASARSLGSQGASGVADLAAALQIARRGAGDASTAANNLANFLGKLGSKDTIKNFKGMGVDVVKELAYVKKQGISPIEHFIKLIDKKTKGGRVDLLSKLFGDKQVTDFIRPMIADFGDYIDIRNAAENADGVIDRQFNARMQNAEERFKKLRISLSERGTEIGSVVLGPIAAAADRLAESLNTLDQRAGVFDQIGTRFKGFMSGLGIGDGSVGSLYDELDRILFGDIATIEADSDRLGRAFLQFKSAGENFRAAVDGFSAADTIGGKLTALGGGISALTNSLSGGSMLALGLGGLALARLGKGLFGLAFGSAGKLALIAVGLSALAGAGGDMSMVDWAGVALGVGMLAGPVGKLAASMSRLGKAKAGAEVLKGAANGIKPTVGPSAPVRVGPTGPRISPSAAGAAPIPTGFWSQAMGAVKALGIAGMMVDFVGNAGQGKKQWTPEQRTILDDMIAKKKAAAAPQPSAIEAKPTIEAPISAEGDRAALKAEAIGLRISQAFSVTAKPIIDSSSVDAFIGRMAAAQRAMELLQSSSRNIGSGGGSATTFDGLHAGD